MEQRNAKLKAMLKDLVSAKQEKFSNLTSATIPKHPGVYLISKQSDPLYVGRSGNLRQRIPGQLRGNSTSSNFKVQAVKKGLAQTIGASRDFLISQCNVRWLKVSDLTDRACLECYAIALLQPPLSISKEH